MHFLFYSRYRIFIQRCPQASSNSWFQGSECCWQLWMWRNVRKLMLPHGFIFWRTGHLVSCDANNWYKSKCIVPISLSVCRNQRRNNHAINNNPGFPRNRFHLGPSIGVDLVVAKLTLGYSFRSERINNHFRSFAGSINFIPSASMRIKLTGCISDKFDN